MLYMLRFRRMPMHPEFGLMPAGCVPGYADPGPAWHDLAYEPGGTVATITITAETVAGARAALAKFYGRPVLIAWDHASWGTMSVGAPPPPDWPTGEPAAVCPECKDTGRVLLFTGYSPCSLCPPRPADAVE